MAERTLNEMISDLRQSQQAFLEIIGQVDETGLYQRRDEEGWSLAETLVHIAEARQFFSQETRRVLATPGVKVGRTMQDEGRLNNIEEHGRDSRQAIRQRLMASHAGMVNLLEELSDDDLQIKGEHLKYGPQTLAEFIQRFMVEHDQAHVNQAKTLVS